MEEQKQPEEKLGLLLDLYNSIPEYSGASHVRNHFIRNRGTQFLRKQYATVLKQSAKSRKTGLAELANSSSYSSPGKISKAMWHKYYPR